MRSAARAGGAATAGTPRAARVPAAAATRLVRRNRWARVAFLVPAGIDVLVAFAR